MRWGTQGVGIQENLPEGATPTQRHSTSRFIFLKYYGHQVPSLLRTRSIVLRFPPIVYERKSTPLILVFDVTHPGYHQIGLLTASQMISFLLSSSIFAHVAPLPGCLPCFSYGKPAHLPRLGKSPSCFMKESQPPGRTPLFLFQKYEWRACQMPTSALGTWNKSEDKIKMPAFKELAIQQSGGKCAANTKGKHKQYYWLSGYDSCYGQLLVTVATEKKNKIEQGKGDRSPCSLGAGGQLQYYRMVTVGLTVMVEDSREERSQLGRHHKGGFQAMGTSSAKAPRQGHPVSRRDGGPLLPLHFLGGSAGHMAPEECLQTKEMQENP